MTDSKGVKYLKKTYPARISLTKQRRDEYWDKVVGEIQGYVIKKDCLVFQRSQENLYIFGFPQEACIVSRVVLEDAIRRKYSPSTRKTLKTIIDECLEGETKDLAHKIRENGNDFAHENWKQQTNFPKLVADEKAIESAKALNQVLVNLGYKEIIE